MSHYYRHHRRRRNVGREIALRHIEQAGALTHLLGGTDQDVKQYLFGLPPHMLDLVLDVYGRDHGQAAASYARSTIPRWQSGAVQMSGMVAERLFRLLPRFMDLPQKYGLVEKLWKNYSPRSSYVITFGPTTSREEVMALLRQHLDATVKAYRVPDPLERRFRWLSEGDVGAYQTLLNHFLHRDRDLVIAGIEAEVVVILGHAGHLSRYARQVSLGGHHVEIAFEPRQSEAKIAPAGASAIATERTKEGIGCAIIMGGLLLWWIISALSR